MTISLIQVPFSSEECEVAFYHSLQSTLMGRLDEIRVGSVANFYEKLGDESIYLLFAECCQQNGFEVVCDTQHNYWLVKTPRAALSTQYIYALVNQYKVANNLTDEDVYRVSDINKSYFKNIATNYLGVSGAKLQNSPVQVLPYWKFSDESCLSIGTNSIKSWNCDPVITKECFTEFVGLYMDKLDSSLVEDGGTFNNDSGFNN
jgi:hypothetical protein